MTFTANEFRGEDQVEKALNDIGASKLVVDMQANAESLLTRAEDMLWPGSERRTPWRDIVARSIENPRWTWLPPRGLDGLKDVALKQGRWRDHGDGYIEKPPFPPSRTDVTVVEKDYDDRTGESTLIVTARDAGKTPRILYAKRPDALPANPAASSMTRSSRPTRSSSSSLRSTRMASMRPVSPSPGRDV